MGAEVGARHASPAVVESSALIACGSSMPDPCGPVPLGRCRFEKGVRCAARFAASGWIFCPGFALAPPGVAPATPSVASTNPEQNLSTGTPQTGEVRGLAKRAEFWYFAFPFR